MQSSYYDNDTVDIILRLLTYENALICTVSLCTGLRISDVLNITTAQINKKSFTITERKTGKKKVIRLSSEILKALRDNAGPYYVFQSRLDPNKPKSRQAVYKDLQRAQKALRLSGVLSPHSMRKIYAVERLRKTGDIQQVQQSLNHAHIEDTLLYALSDLISSERRKLPKRAAYK